MAEGPAQAATPDTGHSSVPAQGVAPVTDGVATHPLAAREGEARGEVLPGLQAGRDLRPQPLAAAGVLVAEDDLLPRRDAVGAAHHEGGRQDLEGV
eukprot:CAMPEP_0179357644 /NCGR_PEP_ID=MMETSP0797-20121207/78516_1 /TAXON_ID=47934 /ORGANISM="Dinophysis acuminata, Strain DAEP01" /LENGTH=95 /DNA_ID=CAMNT_0021072871 /DNA_START=280 /DNA_END=564 /DNA_ORIENTATION=-